MAARRGGTSAVRRWGLRWLDLELGRAPVDYSEPSASAIAWNGRLQRRGHDDGHGGEAPVSLCTALTLTEREWRAREEATGCWGDGGAMAVVREWLGASCAQLWRRRSCGNAAGAARRRRGPRRSKWVLG